MKFTKTKENAGKFLLDVAKLVIGGVILAGIMQQGRGYSKLYIYGGLSVLFFVAWGFILITLSDNENKKEKEETL